MARYTDIVRDGAQNGLPGAIVTVRDYPSGELASITDDNGTPIINATITADANGAYYFNAASGIYTLEFRLVYFEPARKVSLIDVSDTIRADLSDTGGASLIQTAAGETVQQQLDRLASQDFSSAPAAQTIVVPMDKTFAGRSAGDSDYRVQLISAKFTGAYGGYQQNNLHIQAEARHTAGTLSFLQGVEAYARLGLVTGGVASSNGNVASMRVFSGHVANESQNGTATDATVFNVSDIDIDPAGMGTIVNPSGLRTQDLNHARVTGIASAVRIGNMTQVTGHPAAGVYSEMSGGTDKWFLLSPGGANSAMFGNLRLGDNSVPADKLEVKGFAKISRDGTTTSVGTYHEVATDNNDYVAHIRNTHPTAPSGLRVRFTAASPNNTVQNFFVCEDMAGTRFVIYSNGALLSQGLLSASGGVGYAAGAGAAATQLTSKTTTVTLNKVCGQFTTHNAALAAGARATFQVSNTNIAATDVINCSLQSGQATEGTYRYWIEKVAAGSFKITIENLSGGSLSESLVFNFAVIKAVAA